MTPLKKTQKEIKKYQAEVITQMLKLATSGFGLVAALAWNELIKTIINDYVKTKISVGSGLASMIVYALVVTLLAVLVTLQLSKLKKRVETDKEKEEEVIEE